MESNEIRSRFLKFFENRGHKIIPSASLVPENDLSVLFTTAGMQQFKPYYTNPQSADKDFGNRNIVTVQKCIRTSDIDEVGDATHLTFLEMLGNFSFGGYGRREAITFAYDFIIKELGLEISYVTFYKGEGVVPRDEESKDIWASLGVKDIRVDGADVFWGPTGESGPCGPTTEIYCKNGEGVDVEIWNIVFNEYFCDGSREKLDKGEATLKKLDILGIDTGMGLERLTTTVQKKRNIYETDLFNNEQTREEKIVADHVKAALFMVSDGVVPSNTGHGYVLRRLIRRAVRFSQKPLMQQIDKVKKVYQGVYILDDKGEIEKEENKFRKTLERGLKKFETYLEHFENGVFAGKEFPPEIAFDLYTEDGFPKELTFEEVKSRGMYLDEVAFDELILKHQEKSRTASVGMFKGGLANHNEKTIKLHTAHHLLLAGLKAVVDKNIKQRGSNITEERLRMDFLCDHKLTDEEKKKVEDWVNNRIKEKLPVIRRELPRHLAETIGAEMEFGVKYPDTVSVYFIGPSESAPYDAVSKEFCGGPHISNTKELGQFKIQKEEAVAQGIRRIKATLL